MDARKGAWIQAGREGRPETRMDKGSQEKRAGDAGGAGPVRQTPISAFNTQRSSHISTGREPYITIVKSFLAQGHSRTQIHGCKMKVLRLEQMALHSEATFSTRS